MEWVKRVRCLDWPPRVFGYTEKCFKTRTHSLETCDWKVLEKSPWTCWSLCPELCCLVNGVQKHVNSGGADVSWTEYKCRWLVRQRRWWAADAVMEEGHWFYNSFRFVGLKYCGKLTFPSRVRNEITWSELGKSKWIFYRSETSWTFLQVIYKFCSVFLLDMSPLCMLKIFLPRRLSSIIGLYMFAVFENMFVTRT